MSLTAHVLHIAGIHFLGIEELPGSPLHVLLGFLVAVTVFATLWSRHFRCGPLEWLLGKATKPRSSSGERLAWPSSRNPGQR